MGGCVLYDSGKHFWHTCKYVFFFQIEGAQFLNPKQHFEICIASNALVLAKLLCQRQVEIFRSIFKRGLTQKRIDSNRTNLCILSAYYF